METIRTNGKKKPFRSFYLRCCSMDLRFNKALNKPSASYMKLYSTHDFKDAWECKCKCAETDHVRDWSGSDKEHARFRTNARTMLVHRALVCAKRQFSCKMSLSSTRNGHLAVHRSLHGALAYAKQQFSNKISFSPRRDRL